MEIGKFLNTQGLKRFKPPARQQGYISFLERMGEKGERMGLHQLFMPFQQDQLETVDDLATVSEQLFLQAMHPNIFDQIEDPKWRSKRKEVQQHVREIVGIGMASGTLFNPDKITIHDLCSGNGRLGILIADLRRDLSTRVFCWDYDSARERNFNELRRAFFGETRNDSIVFKNNNVGDLSLELEASDQKNTHLLAKHACGSATDFLIEQISKLAAEIVPAQTLIGTCCHGSALKVPPAAARNAGVTASDWEFLLKAAERPSSRGNFSSAVGRVSMRIADVFRAGGLPDHLRGEVVEILPPERSIKNHGIRIVPRD